MIPVLKALEQKWQNSQEKELTQTSTKTQFQVVIEKLQKKKKSSRK